MDTTISAQWIDFLGLSKLLKERQWEKAGAEVLSVVLAPSLQAELHKWAICSAVGNPLCCMALSPFKTLKYVRRLDIHGIHKKTWKQMSLCALSRTYFRNLSFGNLFCVIRERLRFQNAALSPFVHLLTLSSSEVWCQLVCSHYQIVEKSFWYVCKPWQNVLRQYERSSKRKSLYFSSYNA